MEASVELPRYSDKYRPSPASQPTLKRKDLHQPFFPQEIFEEYFNPKKRKICEDVVSTPMGGLLRDNVFTAQKKVAGKRVNLDEMVEDGEEQVRVVSVISHNLRPANVYF